MRGYRFGEFEFRPESGELFRDGARVRLQPQPVQILAHLLERPGELVTRLELVERLWGGETYGEVEAGLNIAVKKLRNAIGDSAEQPRYIETLPRRGYRFVGRVEADSGDREDAPTVPAPSRRRPRAAWIGVCLAGLMAGGVLWMQWTRRPQALDFRPRDAVVIAQFSNETGEASLDGVIEASLEGELGASPYVSVASAERIGDALKLMRRPVVPRVPLALAREVCQRDPGLRAAVGGEIRKVGSDYFLSAEIVRPADGSVLTRLTESAGDRDGILGAIRRLSAGIRGKLGEVQPEDKPGAGPPEKVATNSLEAFKLYCEADALGRASNWLGMEAVLRRAVAIDPEFASAHMILALALHFQANGGREAECMRSAHRAFELAGRAPEAEELFIRGCYAYLREKYDESKRLLEAHFRNRPDHFWGYVFLVRSCEATGDLAKLPAIWDQMLLTRPNVPRYYRNAALQCFCGPKEDPARAVALAEKAVRLAEEQGDEDWHNRTLTWLYQTRAMAAWLSGDVARSYAEIGKARKLMAVFTSPALPGDLSFGYLTLGRLEEAEAMLQQSPSREQKAHWDLWRAILRRDSAGVARLAVEAEKFPFFDTPRAQALARAGRFAAVEKMLAGYRQPTVGVLPQSVAAIRGELAFRRRRVRESIEILRQFLADVNSDGLYEQLPAAQTLAQAYVMEGQRDKAILTLEKATAAPRLCNDFDRTVFWPYVRFDLLKLYRSAGRHPEAEVLHGELANLMRLADAGHVLLAGLKRDAAEFPPSRR